MLCAGENFFRLMSWLLVVFLLACSAKPPQDPLQGKTMQLMQTLARGASQFGEPVEPPSLESVFKLSDEQAQDFFTYLNAISNRHLMANQIIYNYLEKRLKQFNYHSDTFNATDALRENQGNCLSLALLTHSLAKLAKVDIGYQLVETEPVYQKSDNIIITSQHIRSLLYESTVENQVVLFRNSVKIDYFNSGYSRPLRSVYFNEFASMYYSNLAAEFFIKNQLNQAFWYSKKSLEIESNNPIAINMMAILFDRKGDFEAADEMYQLGLEVSREKLELLSNYHGFLLRHGRSEEAQEIKAKLDQIEDPNPFKWVSLANSAYNEGDYHKAIQLYRKAAKQADYLHEPLFGIARAEFQLGELNKAKLSLEKAIEHTHQEKVKKLYQAKYQLLTELLSKSSQPVSFSNEDDE